jgi:hypothetical protein
VKTEGNPEGYACALDSKAFNLTLLPYQVTEIFDDLGGCLL